MRWKRRRARVARERTQWIITLKNERGRLCDARDALERETRDAARARAHPRSNRPTPVEFCACIRLRSMTSTTPRRF